MSSILLIEPDRLLAETYFLALDQAGHRVMACAGAQTAVLVADRQRPDLVILELQLVEHSGIEFLYELRSYPEWQDIPVIVHSLVPPAEFRSSRRLLEEDLGVKAYLYKPRTSLRQLLDTVREYAPVKA
jgi:two-component system phosphate regulon response regulator PhoB